MKWVSLIFFKFSFSGGGGAFCFEGSRPNEDGSLSGKRWRRGWAEETVRPPPTGAGFSRQVQGQGRHQTRAGSPSFLRKRGVHRTTALSPTWRWLGSYPPPPTHPERKYGQVHQLTALKNSSRKPWASLLLGSAKASEYRTFVILTCPLSFRAAEGQRTNMSGTLLGDR